MKLKRLDIHGFKSFYQRTTLAFDEGVTAVVGPNGCGKSNIVDAIKWVMGEQGPRSLRGNAMEDVVFAGSERRGPMGICEVCLTFVNDGSAEVPARWREVPELAVERRLERGKGSDYFINKQRCRLSDVQELIAGTGVGSGGGGQRAYAIIEQGQIGAIVSAKADERRLLIEEAAGITRYRSRKRVAERKMAETRLNLERVQDVVGEIEQRLRILQRQAQKAERFQAYRAEAEAIGRRLAWAGLETARARFEGQQRHTEGLATTEAEASGAVEAAERAETTSAAEAERARAAAQALADTQSRLERDVALAEGQLRALDRERAALEAQLASLAEEHDDGGERAAALSAEAEAAGALAARLAEEHAADQTVLAAQEAQRASAHRALLDARAGSERLRREEAEEIHGIARARAQREAAERQALDLRERAAGLMEDRGVAQAEHARLTAAASQASTEAEARALELEEARRALAEADAAARARTQQAQGADARERAAAEALAGLRGELNSLEAQEARHADLGAAGQRLLGSGLPGIVGPVASALDVPAALERAVAAGLDRRLQAVLVHDLEAARAALGWLASGPAARALLALADAEPRRRAPVAPSMPGVLGRLIDHLPGPHPPWAQALLGDILLAQDLEQAVAASAQWPGPVVTVEGARIEGRVFLLAGGEGPDPAPLSRRRALKALRARQASLEADRAAAQGEVEAARAAAGGAQTAVEVARRAAHTAELALTAARKDHDRYGRERDSLRARLVRLEGDVERLHGAAEDALGRAAEVEDRLASLEGARTDRARLIAEADARAVQAEAARDAAVEALHGLRARAAARVERLDAAKASGARVDRLRAELTAQAERTRRTRAGVAQRLAALDAERVAAAAALIEASQGATGLKERLARAREIERSHGAAAQAARATSAAARQGQAAARERLVEARLTLQAARLEVERQAAQISERFGVSPDQLALESRAAGPVTAEERQRQVELEALLDKLGDVNPGAIEEYGEVATRFEFLDGQRADLEAALNDLARAVARIDKTSRRLFAETFEAVNGHFKALFPRLFRGGEAELALTDPEDLLGTGIEMLVRPPGKTVQNVALLSGGEKAMCAIALVFAVFRVKPSPFCLLDEVDAPLDDANIGRFNEVVREMAQASQVLLITHNKRTMEIADVLYGITMEEAGISKLVSVRMT